VTFGEALKSFRGKVSQKALATAVGVNQSAIAAVETGRRNTFSREVVTKIERHLGTPVGALARYLPADHTARQLADVEVPFRGIVWGGPFGESGHVEPGAVFRLTGRFPSHTFVLQVRGGSVHGYGVHDGDHIAVRPTEEVEDGALIVARQGNEYTLKGCKGGKLFSFQAGTGKPVPLDVNEPCQVVGVMLRVVDGERRFLPRSNTIPKRPKKK
jgi:SOS-response transcriptional repressor LexA